MILFVLTMTVAVGSADKSWNKEHDHNNLVDVSGPTSHLERLEVVCSKDHMTVHMHFDQPFYGVVFSQGSARHERCVHVGPRSGATSMSFNIRYDSCGTIEDLGGQFHENTIVIQFDEDILEAWDQAKRLRCEWLESFEKKSSKPTLAISDLDVVELNFQGDDIDCWMEVQEGKGPWARQVGGLVPIGSPLTLVIAINDHSREFDMRIKRCSASDGKGSEIELTDDKGCVIRSSLMTPFAKIRDFGGKATLVAYSHLFAFKFPDKMDVFVHCIVEVCRHGCPDSCTHQQKGYHHQGTSYDSLESKKIQKLAELASSKPIHEIHVLGHHQHLKTPVFNDEYPQPGRERIREILIPAAQTQIQKIILKNVSSIAASESVQKNVKASFSLDAFKAAQKAKETKYQEQSSSSNVHNIFVDIDNSLHAEQKSKFDFQVLHQHQEKPILSAVHQHPDKHILNIAHQHQERPVLNIAHQHQEKPILNVAHEHPDKHILNIAHQHQERPILNIAHPHQDKPILNAAHEHRDKHILNIAHQHRERPILNIALQHQEKPVLNVAHEHREKPTLNVVHKHEERPILSGALQHQEKQFLTGHRIIGHDAHWISETIGKEDEQHAPQLLKDIPHQIPQPEPAAWSADEVKPLLKQEILHQQKPQIDTSIHHYHSKTPYVSKIQWSPDNSKSKEIEDTILSKQIPQPEPSTWTLEEVNPMHSPEAIRLQLHTKRPEEPKPEPSAWSLDDVKGFNKENLRVLSLNHKMKSHSHIVAPVYKEYVNPYSTTMLPQPVYVSRQNYRNISNPNMMKMMMKMSTMLPPTYQTAYWPQRTTARYLKPQRHHYPYPIPQFSPHQQMMMSVIADRRMDDESEDLQADDLSLYHNLSNDNTETAIRRIQIGETASEPKPSSDDKNITHHDENITVMSVTLDDLINKMTSESGTSPDDQIPSESKITEAILSKAISSEPSDTVVTVFVHELATTPKTNLSNENIDKTSGSRPAISSFIPPSLDAAIGVNPESKDRVVPGPRSLDRRKRSSDPVFGVSQKFQAIAPSDLAFEWNLTTDGATVLRGIREEIVYGICMSPAGMSAGIGFILILTLLSIIASVILYEHSCQLSNKTSQLAFFTRNFNGQFEALYKFTRPYLYSGSTNIR